jgi:hypothetical protein
MVLAGLGWLDAQGGAGAGAAALGPHRWFGTGAAGWALVTAGLSVRDERCAVRSCRFRGALLVAAVLVGATGHLGGILVHGKGFFTAPELLADAHGNQLGTKFSFMMGISKFCEARR